MSSEMFSTVSGNNMSERIFCFSFVDSNEKREVEIPLKIPIEESINEFVYRVLRKFMIPYYFFDGTMLKYSAFYLSCFIALV